MSWWNLQRIPILDSDFLYLSVRKQSYLSGLQAASPSDKHVIAAHVNVLIVGEANIENNSKSIVTWLMTPLVLLDSSMGWLSNSDDVLCFQEFLITCNTLFGTYNNNISQSWIYWGSTKIRRGMDGSLTAKLVFWGPAYVGKTTALAIYWSLKQFEDPKSVIAKMTKIQAPNNRTILFDQTTFLWQKRTETGADIKYQVYTVPGLAHLRTQRRIVVQGVDGLILMLDAERVKWTENKNSLKELLKIKDEVLNTGIGERILLKELPYQILLNKIDLPSELRIRVEDIPTLFHELGPGAEAIFEDVASNIKSLSTQTAKNVLKELIKEELAHSNHSKKSFPEHLSNIKEPINLLMEKLCSNVNSPSK